MFVEKKEVFARDGGIDQRRHPRKTVFKSALLYPVLRQASLSVKNISQNGLRGHCALPLGLREQVHVSFDDETFVTGEVRWTIGPKCGLLMEDPIMGILDGRPAEDDVGQAREARVDVDISATLATTAPVILGTIRNMSLEGMMIEANGLREGTILLVKTRGRPVRMARVQWSSGGMIGLFFNKAESERRDQK